MSFKKLFFGGQAYGDSVTESDKKYLERFKETVPSVGLYDSKLEKQLNTGPF